MSWHHETPEDCDMFQALHRDDGELLGIVLPPRRRGHLRLHDHGRAAAPGRVPTDDAARRAVGSEEGALWRSRGGWGWERRTPGATSVFGLTPLGPGADAGIGSGAFTCRPFTHLLRNSRLAKYA